MEHAGLRARRLAFKRKRNAKKSHATTFCCKSGDQWKLTGTTPAQCYAHCAGKHIDSWSFRTVLTSVLLQARVWAIHERFWWIRAIHPAVFMVIGPFQCCRHAVRLLTLLGHCSVSSSRSISMLLACCSSVTLLGHCSVLPLVLGAAFPAAVW